MKTLHTLLCLLLLSSLTLSAQNQRRNKGAGVSQEVLDAYQALNFEGMPYRFLLPENYDPKKSYPLVLNLHNVGTDQRSEAPCVLMRRDRW